MKKGRMLKWILGGWLLAAALGLAGCGTQLRPGPAASGSSAPPESQIALPVFDAAGYVEALLNAAARGETAGAEQYLPADASAAQVLAAWEQCIAAQGEAAAQAMVQALGYGAATEEAKAQYAALFRAALAKASYRVTGAQEMAQGGWQVAVECAPLLLWDEATQAALQEAAAAWAAGVDATQTENEAYLQQLAEAYLASVLGVLQARVEAPVYGEAQTITVRVVPGAEGYTLEPADNAALFAALLPGA